jgi:hypothetical protein
MGSADTRFFSGAVKDALSAVAQVTGRPEGNFGFSFLIWKLKGGAKRRMELARKR